MEIHNPHDKFFKKTFGDITVTKDFLTNYLPSNIIGIIDLESLEAQKDSYIDKELKSSFSDLLFKANINNQAGYLYFLFEHKSYPSRDISFQLLKYIVKIWDSQINKAGHLAAIIPLVIYHGKYRWNIKQSLDQIISGYKHIPQEVQSLIPNFHYLLYDLSGLTDEQIKGAIKTKIAITALRDIYKRGFVAQETLSKAIFLLQKMKDKEQGLECLEILLRYIFSAKPNLARADFNAMVKKLESSYPEGSEKIMTLAELFREEGRKKGIEVGEIRALTKTLIKLLIRKFGPVPKDLHQKIANLDSTTLDIMIDRIFDYNSLDDIKPYLQ